MGALVEGKRVLVEGMRSEKYVDLIGEYGWDLLQATRPSPARRRTPC